MSKPIPTTPPDGPISKEGADLWVRVAEVDRRLSRCEAVAARLDQSPTVSEIAELTARLRRITQAGAAAAPEERQAFLAAKREILARIEATR